MKTALVGNGLSIAYNSQLACPALLRQLTTQLAALGTATDVEETLSKLANSLIQGAGDDLESLLGPLDLLGGAVGHLGALASLTTVAPQSIVTAASEVEGFARGTYKTGTSHVLETIAASSQTSGGHDVIDRFASEITDSSPAVTVATLNYDGLLHSGALNTPNIADLAAGYEEDDFTVVPGLETLKGQRLRRRDDIPSEVQVINLHGSLGWLELDGEFVKFKIPELRSQSYWANWRAGRSDWSPVVVLTNQQAKSRRVLEYPFYLAYSIFESRLRMSTHWLVAGYGLGDEPVNNAIAGAAKASNSALVECLVVTRGQSLTPARVSAQLGIPATKVKICTHGFPEVFQCPKWISWKNA